MNPSDEISVHAFVDGQLDARDYAAMLDAMARDAQLRARVCEIQQLKQLVRAAWPMPPADSHRVRASHPLPWRSLAAALFVTLAAVGGWQVYRAGSTGVERTPLAHTSTPAAQQRILFHVATANPVALEEMFSDLAFLLEENRRAGRPLWVEVIANADGLDLLRLDTTRYAERIRDLVQRYPNLKFSACRNTMERLRREEGIVVRLVPEAGIIESGVVGVARRQSEGWSYIRV